MYPGDRRGNNSRPHAKTAMAWAWQGVARFARLSLRGDAVATFAFFQSQLLANATIRESALRLSKTAKQVWRVGGFATNFSSGFVKFSRGGSRSRVLFLEVVAKCSLILSDDNTCLELPQSNAKCSNKKAS